MRMEEAREALKSERDRVSPQADAERVYATLGKMASVMPLLAVARFFLHPPLFLNAFLLRTPR
jgi:hypothetical protein